MSSKPLRESLTTAVTLEPDNSVSRALGLMKEGKADFGVVVRSDGKYLGLVSKTKLAGLGKQTLLSKVFAGSSPPLVVSARVELDKAVPGLAAHFKAHPELEGAILNLDRREFVVSRKTVLDRARANQPIFGLDRLEGTPLDLVFYVCPVDGETQMLNYYTGAAPVCSAGHPMSLME